MNLTKLLSIPAQFQPLLVQESDFSPRKCLSLWNDCGLTVRIVRGDKMRTVDSLFNEISAAFQFPLYFGENWEALNECLADLDWLPKSRGYVLGITRPLDLLVDADRDQLLTFSKVLRYTKDDWARPIHRGDWHDRPAKPFHVVMLCEESQTEAIAGIWRELDVEVDLNTRE